MATLFNFNPCIRSLKFFFAKLRYHNLVLWVIKWCVCEVVVLDHMVPAISRSTSAVVVVDAGTAIAADTSIWSPHMLRPLVGDTDLDANSASAARASCGSFSSSSSEDSRLSSDSDMDSSPSEIDRVTRYVMPVTTACRTNKSQKIVSFGMSSDRNERKACEKSASIGEVVQVHEQATKCRACYLQEQHLSELEPMA